MLNWDALPEKQGEREAEVKPNAHKNAKSKIRGT